MLKWKRVKFYKVLLVVITFILLYITWIRFYTIFNSTNLQGQIIDVYFQGPHSCGYRAYSKNCYDAFAKVKYQTPIWETFYQSFRFESYLRKTEVEDVKNWDFKLRFSKGDEIAIYRNESLDTTYIDDINYLWDTPLQILLYTLGAIFIIEILIFKLRDIKLIS